MTSDASRLPPPATRWVIPALVGYSHDTLSGADGLYAELFRLQARYFV